MSQNVLKSRSFIKYYFLSLCFLSFTGFLFVGFIVFNRILTSSSNQTPSISHYSKQVETSFDLTEKHQVHDISGQTLTYDVNREVTNENGKVIETYIYEYQK